MTDDKPHEYAPQIVTEPMSARLQMPVLRERLAERIAQERARIPAGKIIYHGKAVLSDYFTIGGKHYYKSGINHDAWFVEMRVRDEEAQS